MWKDLATGHLPPYSPGLILSMSYFLIFLLGALCSEAFAWIFRTAWQQRTVIAGLLALVVAFLVGVVVTVCLFLE